MNENTSKVCRKCNTPKEIAEFYPRKDSLDGYTNKCKECTKGDTASNAAIRFSDPVLAEAERTRVRMSMQERRAAGLVVELSPDKKRKAGYVFRERYPEKRKAQTAVQRAVASGLLSKKPCSVCESPNSEAHHEDYTKPLDVIWYCRKHHRARHVEIKNEQTRAA